MTKENKKYKIKISEIELKNRSIREAFIKLIDAKIREQGKKPFIEVSEDEFELIGKFFGRNLTHWSKYAKNRKELRYKNEFGKYLGKRLVVK